MKKETNTVAPKKKNNIGAKIWKYRGFYLMFLPVLIFAIVFFYVPMFGIRYAFTDFKNGICNFVGFKHFQSMFFNPLTRTDFWNAFINTIWLSVFKLALTTGFAVIVSILMNEIMNIYFKKTVQTIIYLPHFLSWVVTASLFTLILAPDNHGLVNMLLYKIGLYQSEGEFIYWLAEKEWWQPTYFIINLWKETGWQTVIFMATLAGINTDQYEAASIDGAGRFQKMRYITFPALANTILTVFILNLAKVMNLFESAFVMQNDVVKNNVAAVLETYIYYKAFNSGSSPNYGYVTAVGLFKSLVGCVLVLVCNQWSKKVRDGRGIV